MLMLEDGNLGMDQNIEPEGRVQIQGTIGQNRASDVAFYLDLIDIAKKGAEQQVSSEHILEKRAKQTRTLQLRNDKEARDKKTPNVGVIERLKLIGRVGRKLPGLTASERSQLFTLAGYSEGEIRDVMIKGASSVPLNVFTYLTEEHLPTVLGFSEILASEPFLSADLTDPRTLLWMITT